MMTYPTSYYTFWFDWFLDFPPLNMQIQNMGEWGYHFVSIAHSISSFTGFFLFLDLVFF